MEQFTRQERRTLSPAPAERSFLSRTVGFRKPSNAGLENDKGPIGLTTIYKPLEKVVADLVFVHGLGGGSRKTWSKNEDPSLFWPREWLAMDPGFKDVRMHTFGYDSDWNKESILNVHDFAKSLLEWIRTYPVIPRGQDNPIILVCHSLGGIVAKRAYILATQLKEYDDFSRRVRAIFFLATPHRGSSLAEMLTRVLQVTLGSKAFVSDLIPNSSTIQAINDEFPNHCEGLQLFSFYETLGMDFGLKKIIVVPKDSATLGYKDERQLYMRANHRDICKFLSKEDTNYLSLRNALASTLEDLRIGPVMQRRETDYALQQRLKDGLDVDDGPEDDYLRIDSLRVSETCDWIIKERTYQEWQESLDPPLYWVSANAGTGKSVLSSSIIKNLKRLDKNCVFYFFNSGDKWRSSISFFLRSIAWQMALLHTEISAFVLKTCRIDPQLSKADSRTIWRKLFLEGIFKIELSQPQFWIIDGLDECNNESELVPLLVKAAEVRMMRIFITSRSPIESFGSAPSRDLRIISKAIPQTSTKADIRLYLEENLSSLPALGLDRDEARESTLALILEKSSGCFLWARIVLQELRRVHTATEVHEVLESVPPDMDELYMRILDSMSTMPYGKGLAKAILTWTVCAARPLTTDELYHAIQIDINDSIDNIRRSIASTCGKLVYVDDTDSRVRLLHQTARDFLLQQNNTSEFSVDEKAGHKRLASVCLKYLSGREMAGQKQRKPSSGMIAKTRSPFVSYACNSLASHIAFVSSEDDTFYFALSRFFGSPNVLSWIEYIAQNSDLRRLIQTGRSIRQYLQRRARHTVPLGKDIALLDSWAVDLVRLVTKFGGRLLASPASIFNLIPPFCPVNSALKKQFASSSRSMTVSGLSATTWNDCSSTITFQQDTPSALACSSQFFCVGLTSGHIKIYDESTCQDLFTLKHGEGEGLRDLQFSENESLLASVAPKSICVWNVHTGEQLWKLDLEFQCMTLSFLESDRLLLAVTKGNRMLTWDMTTGLCSELTSWLDELDDDYSGFNRRAVSATLVGDVSLLAIAYRGLDIILWDIENEMIHDIYGKDTGSLGPQARRRPGIASVLSLRFSRATEACLLAAAFNDGELAVFNTADGLVQATALANAHTMASSADGLMLVCGNSAGTIQIFEFETLKLLYRVESQEFGIRSLAFSGDNHRLIDIRDKHCRVWDPPVLVRDDQDEENSDTVSVSTVPQDVKLDDSKLLAHITAFTCAEGADAVFCGNLDGSVGIYDANSGQQVMLLFCHSKSVAIVSLSFDAPSGILSSVDSSSRIMAHKLVCDRKEWSVSKAFLDHRVGVAVDQILSNHGCTLMLVSSAETDTLWSIGPDGSKQLATITWAKRRRYRWSVHPTDIDKLFMITDAVAHLYEWQSLTRLTTEKGIQLLGSNSAELAVRSIMPCFDSKFIAIIFSESFASRSKSKLVSWNLNDFTTEAESAFAIPEHQLMGDQIEHVLGTYDHRLVFLHQDGWVCSADSQSFDPEYCNRHFFFPSDWLSTTGEMMLEVLRNGNIVFVQRDEVAIVKRGLRYLEQSQSRGSGKRPSRSRGRLSSSESMLEKASSSLLR